MNAQLLAWVMAYDFGLDYANEAEWRKVFEKFCEEFQQKREEFRDRGSNG